MYFYKFWKFMPCCTIQMHLMFLSNVSLQGPFHAGAYRLMIIIVAATHVSSRLVIFSRRPLFRQKLPCSKQGSKKHAVRKQKDIRREGSNKKRKQTSRGSPTLLQSRTPYLKSQLNLTIISNFTIFRLKFSVKFRVIPYTVFF